MAKKKNKRYFLLSILVCISIISSPQVFHKNKLPSASKGTVSNGSLQNAWLIPRKGNNFKYFSFLNYYILGRAYVHSDVQKTLITSYSSLNQKAPNIKFRYMECSKKNGGRLRPHRTHQNGLSVDFMTPLKKGNKQKHFYDNIGIFRYLMNFDKDGIAKISSKVEIDFDIMALHILSLEEAARKNNLRIKKVILNTNLRDNIYSTKYGSKLKKTGIYFTKNLSPLLNKLHDDHYHIDFTPVN